MKPTKLGIDKIIMLTHSVRFAGVYTPIAGVFNTFSPANPSKFNHKHLSHITRCDSLHLQGASLWCRPKSINKNKSLNLNNLLNSINHGHFWSVNDKNGSLGVGFFRAFNFHVFARSYFPLLNFNKGV